MIPTVIRLKQKTGEIHLVVTVLGNGKLEARYQVYKVGPKGLTSLERDNFWSTEAGAVKDWEEGSR